MSEEPPRLPDALHGRQQEQRVKPGIEIKGAKLGLAMEKTTAAIAKATLGAGGADFIGIAKGVIQDRISPLWPALMVTGTALAVKLGSEVDIPTVLHGGDQRMAWIAVLAVAQQAVALAAERRISRQMSSDYGDPYKESRNPLVEVPAKLTRGALHVLLPSYADTTTMRSPITANIVRISRFLELAAPALVGIATGNVATAIETYAVIKGVTVGTEVVDRAATGLAGIRDTVRRFGGAVANGLRNLSRENIGKAIRNFGDRLYRDQPATMMARQEPLADQLNPDQLAYHNILQNVQQGRNQAQINRAPTPEDQIDPNPPRILDDADDEVIDRVRQLSDTPVSPLRTQAQRDDDRQERHARRQDRVHRTTFGDRLRSAWRRITTGQGIPTEQLEADRQARELARAQPVQPNESGGDGDE